MFGATELPYMAVLRTQILRPTKLLDQGSFMVTCQLLEVSVKLPDLGSSGDTKFRTNKVSSSVGVLQNCLGPADLRTLLLTTEKCL